MATIASPPMTATEFFDFVHRPENWGRFFELERGEILEMPPPGKVLGLVCSNAARILGIYGIERGRGYSCSNDAGMIVEDDPDTVRGPDVSFYDDDEDIVTMERRYAIEPPLLVVEVVSPNDKPARTVQRPAEYLKRGVKLVWVVDPESRTVVAYRQDHGPILLHESDELTGYDILPGFRCLVADLFATPGRKPERKNEPKKKPRRKSGN